MTWKTDWRAGDNYARAGVIDFARLIANYTALRDILNADYGFAVVITLPTADGYRTMPFADVLNMVEHTLEALEVWQKPWPANKEYQPAGALPAYEDINRWESCGAEIEATAARVAQAWFMSGEIMSGEV